MTDAGISLDLAKTRLQAYLTAESGVLSGQAVKFADGRELTRADLKEIREGIVFWQAQIVALGGVTPRARGRVRRGVYRGR